MKSVNIHNIYATKMASLSLKSMMLTLFTLIWGSFQMCAGWQLPKPQVDTAVFLREARQLQELLVLPGNEKYSKDNPAVELVKNIRKNQKKGDPSTQSHYSYDQYDKITLGLLDITEEDLKKHESLKTYLDTTPYGRRKMLKVLLNEKASTILYREEGKEK